MRKYLFVVGDWHKEMCVSRSRSFYDKAFPSRSLGTKKFAEKGKKY